MREYLVSLRTSKGLSQDKAAKALSISQNYLSQIETGNRQADLRLNTLKRFAEIYDVDINFLIEQESAYQKIYKEETQNE